MQSLRIIDNTSVLISNTPSVFISSGNSYICTSSYLTIVMSKMFLISCDTSGVNILICSSSGVIDNTSVLISNTPSILLAVVTLHMQQHPRTSSIFYWLLNCLQWPSSVLLFKIRLKLNLQCFYNRQFILQYRLWCLKNLNSECILIFVVYY